MTANGAGSPGDGSVDGGLMADWLRPLGMVFGGCMGSIVAMEYILRVDPMAGNLVACTEFLFVLCQSMPAYVTLSPLGLKPREASDVSHLVHGGLWVLMSVTVNLAYGYKVSVPVHTLFRSCNIVSSVLVGALFFGVSYSAFQLLAVVAVSVGIVAGTIGDASALCLSCDGGLFSLAGDPGDALQVWAIGITMLVSVLFLQAFLGHIQSRFYERFGKHTSGEYMFYSHVMAMVPTLLMSSNLLAGLRNLAASERLFGCLPWGLVYLLVNNATQSLCINGVFALSARHSPLTVNITLTVRKFSSVIFSVVWFGNVWTRLHSLATVLIFGGSLLYAYDGVRSRSTQPSAEASVEPKKVK